MWRNSDAELLNYRNQSLYYTTGKRISWQIPGNVYLKIILPWTESRWKSKLQCMWQCNALSTSAFIFKYESTVSLDRKQECSIEHNIIQLIQTDTTKSGRQMDRWTDTQEIIPTSQVADASNTKIMIRINNIGGYSH